jgi:MFS family permease
VPSPRGDYVLSREIARLVVGQGGVHACMSGVRMAVPLLALHLGHGAAVAGALVALFGVAQLVLSMPAGRIADRHGLRRPVIGGALAALLGTVVAAAWPTLPGLCLAALLEGGAIAVVVVAVQRQAGRLARDASELRRLFSWASFTPAASNFVGPALTGLAIDGFGYRAAFLLLGLGPLISCALVGGARETPQPAHDAATRGSAWQLWRDATVRRVLLMNWFVSATWEVHGVMVPLIGHARGFSAAAIGGILGSIAVTAAAVRLLVPWISRHAPEWTLITGALAMAAVVLGVYPLTNSVATMGACSMLLGVAIGSVQPLVMSLLHQITPPHQRGQAVALRLVLVNASSISMPLLAGTVGGLIGAAGVLWAVAAVMMAGVYMAMGLRHMPPPSN